MPIDTAIIQISERHKLFSLHRNSRRSVWQRPVGFKTMKYGEIYVAVMINTPNLLDNHISTACSALDLVENTGYKVFHSL